MPSAPEPLRAHSLGKWVFRAPFVALALLGAEELHATRWMPGSSFHSGVHPVTQAGRDMRTRLGEDVDFLSKTIGERNVEHPDALRRARDYVASRFSETGQDPVLETFTASGVEVSNVVVELKGAIHPEEIVVIGAHYDSARGTPGADDDATGVAALCTLAQRASDRARSRTLRFVAFVNEEPPYFQTVSMGSFVHAKHARDRGEHIIGMLSLEMLGYFSNLPGSQHYPFPLDILYPSTGNFIAFVSDRASRDWLTSVIGTFRESAQIASEGAALPASTTGVGWSDHWSFWQAGYAAAMVTDTALFRYPHYHSAKDVPGEVSIDRLARVVDGLDAVVTRVGG